MLWRCPTWSRARRQPGPNHSNLQSLAKTDTDFLSGTSAQARRQHMDVGRAAFLTTNTAKTLEKHSLADEGSFDETRGWPLEGNFDADDAASLGGSSDRGFFPRDKGDGK